MQSSDMSAPVSDAAPATDRLWRFIGYYGLSEAARRVTRIGTTMLLARLLAPADFGIAATAMTVFELVRVVTETGIIQSVVRASDADLASTCRTARRLMWLICASAAVVQTFVGVGVALWTGRPELAAMLATLAMSYLIIPTASIQCFLVMRASRHGVVATIGTAQNFADNVMTILLALAGCGAWAIVLPKVLTTPLWAISYRRLQTWTPDPAAQPVPAWPLVKYALPLVGAELLTVARMQMDKVIVGAVLGIEALGVYYFIYNAGIGLSLSLTGAFANSLFPHFAAAGADMRELLARFDRSVLRTGLPLAGVIVLQAMAAPIYVPVLFGAKWSGMGWLVAVLCASAATKLLADAGAQALRAAGATGLELKGMMVLTGASLLALAAGLTQGLAGGIVAMAVCSALVQLGFTQFARRKIAARIEPLPGRIAHPRPATILHLLDDPALGGVTRSIDAIERSLGAGFAQARRVVAPCRSFPPALADDVVVVHFTANWRKVPYLIALRLRRGGRPVVLVEHSYSAAFQDRFVRHPRRFHAMLRLAYGLADHVVAVSYGQAAWMRRSRLIAAGKVSVIAPFGTLDDLHALLPPTGREGPLRVGAFGRYCAQKGFATLIAALRDVDPAVATLNLRGLGPDGATLQALANDLPHVTVGAAVTDLAGFLGAVDAIAVPSCFEPFGLTALEARIAARPVIVTDVDGLPEQVEPGAGYIVQAGDAAGLASAITELACIKRTSGLHIMGLAARESAVGHGDLNKRRWISLLEALAQRQPGRRDRAGRTGMSGAVTRVNSQDVSSELS